MKEAKPDGQRITMDAVFRDIFEMNRENAKEKRRHLDGVGCC